MCRHIKGSGGTRALTSRCCGGTSCRVRQSRNGVPNCKNRRMSLLPSTQRNPLTAQRAGGSVKRRVLSQVNTASLHHTLLDFSGFYMELKTHKYGAKPSCICTQFPTLCLTLSQAVVRSLHACLCLAQSPMCAIQTSFLYLIVISTLLTRFPIAHHWCMWRDCSAKILRIRILRSAARQWYLTISPFLSPGMRGPLHSIRANTCV